MDNKFPFDTEKQDSDSLRMETEDDRVIRMVRSFMDSSREYRKPFMDLVNEARDLFRNHSLHRYSKVQKANLKLAKAHEVIYNLLPQLLKVYSKKPYMTAKGREPSDLSNGEKITDYFSFLTDQMQLPLKLIFYLIELLVAGTAIAKTPYRFEQKFIKQTVNRQLPVLDELGNQIVDPMTGQPVQDIVREKIEQLETVFDGPDLQVLNFGDFFPDWAVKEPGNIQSMRGVVHRSFLSFDELKELEKTSFDDGTVLGIYTNLDKLKSDITFYGGDAWSERKADTENLDSDERYKQLNIDENKKHLGKIEIWEYWGKYKKKGKVGEYVITIANGNVVIRNDKNPIDYQFKPFIACVSNPVPGEFYGDSDIMLIASTVKEMTALRNARLDQVKISLNKMFKIERSAGVNLKSLAYRPHGVVLTNSNDGIQPIEHGDVAGSAFRDYSQMDFELQSAAGIYNPAQQTGNIGRSFSRTARGVAFLEGITGGRTDIKRRLIDLMFFTPLFWMMFQYCKQFTTDDIYVRVINPQTPDQMQNPFTVLPADAFSRPFDFEVNTLADEMEDYEKLNTFLQYVQIAEQSQPGTVKMGEIIRQLARNLFGTRLYNIIRSPAEIQQMMQQQMLQQSQQQVPQQRSGVGTNVAALFPQGSDGVS